MGGGAGDSGRGGGGASAVPGGLAETTGGTADTTGGAAATGGDDAPAVTGDAALSTALTRELLGDASGSATTTNAPTPTRTRARAPPTPSQTAELDLGADPAAGGTTVPGIVPDFSAVATGGTTSGASARSTRVGERDEGLDGAAPAADARALRNPSIEG
jgi:hypothetical protein